MNAPIPESYKYVPFEKPRMGMFRVEKTPSEYKFPNGWVQVEKPHLVIGETDFHFITEIKYNLTEGMWVGDEVIYSNYSLPLGVHKSRLVTWIDTQLQLF